MSKVRALTSGIVAMIVVVALLLSGGVPLATGEGQQSAKKPDKVAVDRARKTTQTLDNVYKQTIVLITDKYVNKKGDYPAGRAAIRLFENISKSGSHKVRLIDATGDPYSPRNVAKDDFEREGIKRLKAGANVYEQVVQEKGKPYLRTLTPVPVVMKKCITCHEHYAKVKKGAPVGAISYVVPIE